MKAFVAFCETMNFTRAAEELAISQPALHVKIKKLSAQLEAPLYIKDRRRLYLTRQGEELARFARECLQAEAAFLSDLRELPERSPVSLIAGSGAYLYLLGEAISDFKTGSQCPLQLLTGDREATLQALRTGKAQMGVTVLRRPVDDLGCERLCSVATKLVVRTDHRLARRRQLSLPDLEGETFIVPPSGAPFREALESYLQQHQVSWKVGVEAGGWALMVHFVSLGLGVAVVNGCCALPSNCRGIALRGIPPVEYYLLTPLRARLPAEAAKLREMLRMKVARKA